jgi:hypothetical protein
MLSLLRRLLSVILNGTGTDPDGLQLNGDNGSWIDPNGQG